MTERDHQPMSLNEKNNRLLKDLSTNRSPHRRTEIRVRKVKLEGRRRLCKLSSSPAADDDSPNWLDSPPKQEIDEKWMDSPILPKAKRDGGEPEESIRDILDDLSSRMESLSVQKPKPRPRAVRESPVEYRSAPSSLSPSPEKKVTPKERGGSKGKGSSLSLSPDKKVTLTERGGSEGEASSLSLSPDKKATPKERAGVKGKAVAAKASEEEDDGGSCVILDGKHERSDDGFDNETAVCDVVEAFRLPGTGVSRSRTYELSGKIVKMLYPHQRDGLKWLWSLHCGGTGGILGDDMGLGKTMQVSAFLAGLFHSRLIKRSLIVAPKTLLAHWVKELSFVGLANKTRDFSGTCTKTRQYELRAILKEGGVLLTTYDIVRNNLNSIKGYWCGDIDQSEDDIVWDYVVLDEGHVIKNPKTQRAKSLHEIPSVHRIIISGTPIQNNLKELWALFNFCCPEILGDTDMFKIRYEHPILRGNDKNASDRDKHVGSTVAKQLRERIKPYFLRRLKSEVFLQDDSGKNDKISKKSEIIVWLRLTSCQRQLYEAFLNSDLVHSAVDGSPLAALTILKKICDHPLLLTKKAAEGVLEGMDTMLNRDELSMVEAMAMNLANMTDGDDALKVDQNVSCKLCFILSLLKKLVEEDHTVLIFSQTRKMLNLIQEAIISEGYKFLRIDGTTKVSERERIVKDFQEGSGAPIFLLTSQVGGLGLTLTKADRVIVVDPAWNPSTDNQSVDRAYRIGQTKDVLVYRLMTCGTIEEKIYKMQIFKGGLFRTATEQKEQTRYFSQKDIKELFSLPEQGFDVSLTQRQLHEEHDQHHILDDSFREHINYLEKHGIAGVSHHSLIYSKSAMVPIVPETNEVQSKTANIIVRSSPSGSSLERVVNGSEHAFKPKDERFTSRRHSSNVIINDIKNSPEYIEDRIKRLSQTLANKALVSNLPDRGDRIKKQISELNTQLCEIRDTPPRHASQKETEIIDLDDLSEDLHRILSV